MWRWLRESVKRLFKRFLVWIRPTRSSPQVSDRPSPVAPSHAHITDVLSSQSEDHSVSNAVSCEPDLLSQVAKLPLAVIAAFLDRKSLFFLSQCSKYLNEKLAPERLAYYVVYDHLINAKKMIDINPTLLTGREVTVTAPSGRVLKDITPLKGALRERGDRMATMIKGSFIKNGWLDKFNSQYDAVFPAGVIEQEGFDFSGIAAVITQATPAVVKAQLAKPQNDSTLGVAFNDFRKELTTQSMAEEVVNPNHILRSWETYEANWLNWSDDQCDLYLNQVFGYSQRLAFASMAKDFGQGVYYIQQNNEPRRDTANFSFRAGGGPCFFTRHCDLGFVRWVDIFGVLRCGRRGPALARFTKLISSTHNSLAELRRPRS